MPRPKSNPKQRYVMISAVAERFEIHPQTLRLYEREGLLTPARSAGNTRLYDEEAIQRLGTILTLTRDLGVNLAGVEVILNLQQQMDKMRSEVDRLVAEMARELKQRDAQRGHALVRVTTGPPVRLDR
jgi:MerR family transcriptional regulator, heat shock protein HspR